MACNVDDVIDEPSLDASNCTVLSDSADEIKLHYKLKYPGSYSIPTRKVLDLLENEVLFSHLKSSVKSFVYHAREIHKIDKSINSTVTSDPAEMEVSEIAQSKEHLNIVTKTPESTVTKETDVLEIPVESTDFSVYDSVHSIKIPRRSYENIKCSRGTFFRRKKPNTSDTCGVTPNVSQPMTGLVFERVEKSVSFPLKCKQDSPITYQGKKEKSREFNSSHNQINNVIILDEK